MKQYIRELLTQGLTDLGGEDATQVLAGTVIDVDYPKFGFGDYASNLAMTAFKKFHEAPAGNPAELAAKLAERAAALDHKKSFSQVSAAGGFINFTLSPQYLQHKLQHILQEREKYGTTDAGAGKTVILEYFQLNIAKPPHVAHLRSAVIGDALRRILRSQGYKVLSDTHVGDWGTQFGIMIAAYKKYGDRETILRNPLEELNQLYTRYNEDMESAPDLREVGKQEFAKLEQGDPENRKLWQWFVDVSMDKLHEMVGLLNLEPFELHLSESFYEDKMEAIVEEALARGIAQTGLDGEIFVDLEAYKMDQGILKKSDGATTYLLRDLAKVKYVWTKYQYFLNLYLVDIRQAHHFNQIFKIAELLGWDGVINSHHLDFGLLSLPEGVLSSRKGTIIYLEKVVEEARKLARQIIEQKNPGLADKETVAQQVGLAALKYFDLSHNRQSDIVFRWDDALSFEGNTGPYLQYAHARIHGILRKAGAGVRGKRLGVSEDTKFTPQELAVMRKLNQFPEILELVMEDFLPNLLTNYLFELAQTFNTFYEANPILQEAELTTREFRLSLITATAQVLINGLHLLGISAPKEM